MFIELLTAIGIGASALPSDASEPLPIIDYPDPTEVMCLAENMYHEAKNQGTAAWSESRRNPVHELNPYQSCVPAAE